MLSIERFTQSRSIYARMIVLIEVKKQEEAVK